MIRRVLCRVNWFQERKALEFNTTKQPPSVRHSGKLVFFLAVHKEMAKGPLPLSNLYKVVQHLNMGPRLTLNGLRRIGLNLAVRNGHAGAR